MPGMTEPRDGEHGDDASTDNGVESGDDASANDAKAASLEPASDATPSAFAVVPRDSNEDAVATSPKTLRADDSAPDPEGAAGHEPPRSDLGEAARALANEADAARAAVEEASKPVERYPAPDARAQRLAGFGCMALMLLLTVGFALVFRIAFRRITSLDTNLNGYEVETVAPDEARRRARDSAQPSTRTAPGASGVAWRTEIAAAFEEARREGRPLLLHFEAGWATASRDMLDGTYANVAVREALASFVPLRIDLTEREPDEQELAQRFVVTALPHVVYLAPDGERLRPDSTTLVDASDMEVFLREALGAYEDGRRFTEPTSEPPPGP